MKIYYLLLLSVLFSCKTQTKKAVLNQVLKIEPVNYREIHEQVQNILQQNDGKFPIMKFELVKENKHLIYFGEQHGNDPADTRFDTIQKYFLHHNPAIILNEGGQMADSVHFKSREAAIQKNGTIGFLKFLADSAKIKLQNADCPDSLEIASLLKTYDAGKVLCFLVLQRFLPQFISGYNGATDVNTAYENFTEKYLIKRCGLTLTATERQWDYFEKLYAENNNNRKIVLENFDMAETEFDTGLLSNINRTSFRIRDSVIVMNIYKAFEKHDKVFIVFGAAHLLAEKTTLIQLFK